jgi:uncharacterized membrane protein (GlpM family)
MMYYTIKVILSAIIVVVISEVSKRSSSWGGIIASLPLVSLLALGWLYNDTHDLAKVAGLARSTFWFVLPSLAFFLLFPFLLDRGRGFPVSLVIALTATGACYVLMAFILKNAGVKL